MSAEFVALAFCMTSQSVDVVSEALSRVGYTPDVVPTISLLVKSFDPTKHALVLADYCATLPKWLRSIRGSGHPIPALAILPSRDPIKTAELLNAGFDAVLTAPYAPAELVAWLVAIRRRAISPYKVLRVGDWALDRLTGQVAFNGSLVYVSNMQFFLMDAMLPQPGEYIVADVLFRHANQRWHPTQLDYELKTLRTTVNVATGGSWRIEWADGFRARIVQVSKSPDEFDPTELAL